MSVYKRELVEMVKIGNINLTEHKLTLKMGGFLSINVDIISNPFCAGMRKTDNICKHCYAYYMSTRYPRLKSALMENYNTLSSRVLTVHEIEQIGDYILKRAIGLRFNSMGELINDIHCENLNLIAMYIKGKKSDFPITMWSKKISAAKLIDNNYITKIYSNPNIDAPQTIAPKGFDGVFNVCTYKWFKAIDEKPNCAGKCRECMKCYSPGDKHFVVYEMIKSDQVKIENGKLEEL